MNRVDIHLSLYIGIGESSSEAGLKLTKINEINDGNPRMYVYACV